MIVIGGFGYLIPLVYIPTYAQFYLNVSKSHGALAISLFNFASTIGRILAGIFADKFFGRFNSFMGSFILSGISIIVLWGNSTSFAILIAFSITFGIIVGGVISLLPVVVADLFGLDVLANMMGICFSGYFFGNVLGPPIGGYFLDKFQNNGAINWLPTIALSASLMMLAGVMGIGIKIIEKKKKLNNL
ncbi:hypothetical protein HK099_003588 [Clydaea vesicula]|uniref:Major facilitator superfamily (MFS) profile domain-containing protein n=1 Tax=Clydaea vesicula TaxID=447962 RepID=A0AAD5U3D8_9FUNG|nr:hypothetical protein HK099_003588 [Clydaea vesicula]